MTNYDLIELPSFICIWYDNHDIKILIEFGSMLKRLATLSFGAVSGVLGYKAYKYYNPEKNISLSSKELIDSYIGERNL